MIDRYSYNSETKSFSIDTKKIKDVATTLAAIGVIASSALKIANSITKVTDKRKEVIEKDKILESKNKKLNLLFDKYKSGEGVKGTKEEARQYYEVLNDIFTDIMKLTRYEKIDGERTIFSTTIAPFIGFLRCILVRDVYILAGQDIGADRIGFELCYEPDPLRAEDLAKDPFRTKIYTHKWPSHGFRVQSIGSDEANDLISDTFDFLSKNPKYLSIRV